MHTEDITDGVRCAIRNARSSMVKVICRKDSAEDAVLRWQWQKKQ